MNTLQATNATTVTTVNTTISHVWNLLTAPSHIQNWVSPSPEFNVNTVVNHFAVGGTFNVPFTPVNHSTPFGFEFSGTYTNIVPFKSFTYNLANGYTLSYEFNVLGESVEIIQSINVNNLPVNETVIGYYNNLLNNFKTYLSSFSTFLNTSTFSVSSPISHVWNVFTTPTHVMNWVIPTNEFTSTPVIENFVVGANFHFPIVSENGTPFEFDFKGTFTNIIPGSFLAYTLENGTTLFVSFVVNGENVELTYSVDFGSNPTSEFHLNYFNTIMTNFKSYVLGTLTYNN